MSAAKRSQEAKWSRKDARKPSLLQGMAGTPEADRTQQTTWRDVDWAMWSAFLVRFTEMGGAVLMGKSRDGNVLNVTLMHEGESVKRWFKYEDVLNGGLEALVNEVYAQLPDKP